MTPLPVTVRAANDADLDDVLGLVGSVMGWRGDTAAAAMWRWKHVENPAGPSPTWLAVEPEGRVVGVRTFLRWRFDHAGAPVSAVRAVDTVTHPDARGIGLFKRLTLHGLEELAREGVDFVFNTPNDQSRPGYLSMGWQPVRRLVVAVRPRGISGLVLMARNRVPADLDSLPSDAGRAVGDGLDDATCRALGQARSGGLSTARTPAYLRWRYAGLPALGYRVLTLGVEPAEGVAVFRLRTRGAAREAAVVELAAPSRRAAARVTGAVLRATGASYALALPGRGASGSGGVPVPRLGPLLVARTVASAPPPADQWRLSLGDVELF